MNVLKIIQLLKKKSHKNVVVHLCLIQDSKIYCFCIPMMGASWKVMLRGWDSLPKRYISLVANIGGRLRRPGELRFLANSSS